MKLSKKFKERYSEFTALYDQDCLEIIEQYELRHDDVEGCVIMTFDEAKGLKVFVEALMKEQGTFEQWKSFDVLCKRILKAEGK